MVGRAIRDVFCFFQAEDGIRDIGVTGVQTCALPISPRHAGRVEARAGAWGSHHSRNRREVKGRLKAYHGERAASRAVLRRELYGGMLEIGRASCRERV